MPARPAPSRRWRSRLVGLLAGYAIDRVVADPSRGHPVAVFGTWAGKLRDRLYADSRACGTVYAVTATAVPVAATWLLARRAPTLTLAAVTWAALGGTTLARTGERMARALDDVAASPNPESDGTLAAARGWVPWLCSREPDRLSPDDIARATIESLSENTSDAVTGTLVWGALAGAPGVVAHRCINTLDAMVGYRTPEYGRFGWASARFDDMVNYLPARVCGIATVLAGPNRRAAIRAWREDAPGHPSPNGGIPESTAAGALGVQLGGPTPYSGGIQDRRLMGRGRAPGIPDVRRAVRLTRQVQDICLCVTTLPLWALARRRG